MQKPPVNENVLIVDDSPANLRLLATMLQHHGYTVRAVHNGEHALEAADLNPPDLILLDIMMPGLNGFEICERLKQNPRTQNIPVIFLSALDEPQNKIGAFAVGGVDYVTKPFNTDEVLARVSTHLNLTPVATAPRRGERQPNRTKSRTASGAGHHSGLERPHPHLRLVRTQDSG